MVIDLDRLHYTAGLHTVRHEYVVIVSTIVYLKAVVVLAYFPYERLGHTYYPAYQADGDDYVPRTLLAPLMDYLIVWTDTLFWWPSLV
jgi:hypothetical protein